MTDLHKTYKVKQYDWKKMQPKTPETTKKRYVPKFVKELKK